MNSLSVNVIIVAYNAPEHLDRCLMCLQGEVPVTVVDNSSSPKVAVVAARHGACYLASGRNRGYAAAVNAGLARLAGGRTDVLLLNPDATVSPCDIFQLERFLRAPRNARVAAVGPRLRGSNHYLQRPSWPFPTPGRMWAEAIGLGWLPAHSTFVVGAVLLLRREAIDEVGLFDERFFLYAEEADWQRRAYERGWTSAVCASVTADHVGAGTSSDAVRREALFHAAQELYIRKWYGPAGWWIYRVAACSGAAARTVIHTHERRKQAARRMILYLRGPRRCAALKSG